MIGTWAAMDWGVLAAFLSAGVLLNLTPGSDVLFAAASGMAGGARAGIAAASGVAIGGLLHTALAALGVAALLAASPLAFSALRYAGAAYLLFLAWRAWSAPPPAPERGTKDLRAAFRRGMLTNLLNPKVALFILAFLPQFTDPALGPVWHQILLLGGLFSITGFFVTAGYGALAGTLRRVPLGAARRLNRVSAMVFAALALRLLRD